MLLCNINDMRINLLLPLRLSLSQRFDIESRSNHVQKGPETAPLEAIPDAASVAALLWRVLQRKGQRVVCALHVMILVFFGTGSRFCDSFVICSCIFHQLFPHHRYLHNPSTRPCSCAWQEVRSLLKIVCNHRESRSVLSESHIDSLGGKTPTPTPTSQPYRYPSVLPC